MEWITVDYTIVSGEHHCTLEKHVKEAINYGWEPQGGLVVVDGMMFQAMIKREKKITNSYS